MLLRHSQWNKADFGLMFGTGFRGQKVILGCSSSWLADRRKITDDPDAYGEEEGSKSNEWQVERGFWDEPNSITHCFNSP